MFVELHVCGSSHLLKLSLLLSKFCRLMVLRQFDVSHLILQTSDTFFSVIDVSKTFPIGENRHNVLSILLEPMVHSASKQVLLVLVRPIAFFPELESACSSFEVGSSKGIRHASLSSSLQVGRELCIS